MPSVAEAKKILSSNIITLPDEELPIIGALGRNVSQDIYAPIDVPSFDNSAMDGFALNYQQGNSSYKIISQIQAGDSALYRLNTDETARIFTGAPMPQGADTVIQQELVEIHNDEISFDENNIFKGVNVRLRGSQCKQGDKILLSGSKITPGSVALLSSVGMRKIRVHQQPKVALIVTGNELIEPGKTLQHGQIYNSNEPAVLSYLALLGITNTISVQVRDNLFDVQYQLSRALQQCDVLIITGGISVGEYDFVYQALINENVKPLFYKVKQKPGKPLFIGMKENKHIFALPGNPAAVLSCINQYVKPCLLGMRGEKESFRPSVLLPLSHNYTKKTPLTNILKAKVSHSEATILSGQDSFNLQSFSEVNAFVVLYEEDASKQKGEKVEVYYL